MSTLPPVESNTTLHQALCALSQPVNPCPMRLVMHKIPAGFPSPATDYIEESFDLNTYLVRNKSATFVFRVKGNSMVNAGILEGDKVIVDRSLKARNHDIVVAAINGEYTIKRLYQTAASVELHPENPDYPPMRFKEGCELEIWGVVTGVVRHYANPT